MHSAGESRSGFRRGKGLLVRGTGMGWLQGRGRGEERRKRGDNDTSTWRSNSGPRDFTAFCLWPCKGFFMGLVCQGQSCKLCMRYGRHFCPHEIGALERGKVKVILQAACLRLSSVFAALTFQIWDTYPSMCGSPCDKHQERALRSAVTKTLLFAGWNNCKTPKRRKNKIVLFHDRVHFDIRLSCDLCLCCAFYGFKPTFLPSQRNSRLRGQCDQLIIT